MSVVGRSCIDIFGAFIVPATGEPFGSQFPTTRAYSCQEGSVAAFDGSNFFVFHNDERLTNCSTSNLIGERVTPNGVVLDPVDATGLIGGIDCAGDPTGSPSTSQSGGSIAIDDCGVLVIYLDNAVTTPGIALRMKRIDGNGQLLDGLTPADFGFLIAQGPPSTSVSSRAVPVKVAPRTFLLAYALNSVPAYRIATIDNCDAYMDIETKSALCELSVTPPGLTGNATISFSVTNNASITGNYLLLPFSQATDHIVPLVPPLAPGGTATMTTSISTTTAWSMRKRPTSRAAQSEHAAAPRSPRQRQPLLRIALDP
ncbi:MAG: hypothetical protein SGJ11_13280, partial [Phycisphaerae bacterium]|nr:hypothetical protein [Phycisphaerae bacterium]